MIALFLNMEHAPVILEICEFLNKTPLINFGINPLFILIGLLIITAVLTVFFLKTKKLLVSTIIFLVVSIIFGIGYFSEMFDTYDRHNPNCFIVEYNFRQSPKGSLHPVDANTVHHRSYFYGDAYTTFIGGLGGNYYDVLALYTDKPMLNHKQPISDAAKEAVLKAEMMWRIEIGYRTERWILYWI